MRMWWINSVKSICGTLEERSPYMRCTIDYPCAIFKDKSIDVKPYHKDFNLGQLSRVIETMKNQNVVNMNILCPWNCLSNCINLGCIEFVIMIQKMLPKINIPLYTDVKNTD